MISHFAESANGLSDRRADGSRKRPRGDEQIDGFEVQAKLAKKARRGFDSDNVYYGLPDQRFQPMDMEVIAELLRIYDTDPLIRIASQVNLNAALGGSVIITDDADDGEPGNKQNLNLREWRAYTYTGYLEGGYRFGCSIGFIPWTYVPHALDKGEPRVLNLTNVQAFFYLNELNEPMYAFFEKPDTRDMLAGGTYFGGKFVGRPIKNVYVTTWNSPGPGGEVRSLVSTILASANFVKTFRKAARRATLKAADPAIITETTPEKKNGHETEKWGDKVDAKAKEDQMRVSEVMGRLVEARRELSPEEFESFYADIMARNNASQGLPGTRLDLETGRKLSKQVLPQGPQDLIGVTLMHQQLLFMLFGVPPSFIQTESARGRISGGDDSNAASVFRNAQKHLKQRLVQLASQAFNTIHNPDKILSYLMAQSFSRHVDERELHRVAHSAQILIPGTPPEDYLEQLYIKGFLKYSAYKRYISTMHAIPEQDLHDEPELSLLDILTGGKESLQKMQMEHDSKMQKAQLKGKEKELEMKQDGDEKKVELQTEATEKNAASEMQTEKVKQKSMDQRLQMELLKQKGMQLKAKLVGPGNQKKAKAKAKKKKT